MLKFPKKHFQKKNPGKVSGGTLKETLSKTNYHSDYGERESDRISQRILDYLLKECSIKEHREELSPFWVNYRRASWENSHKNSLKILNGISEGNIEGMSGENIKGTRGEMNCRRNSEKISFPLTTRSL